MARPTRVYRLDVTYPPNSGWPWKPEGWVDYSNDPDSQGFSWPRARRYLSKSSADTRAQLLRDYGAEVVVVASEPVQWGDR